MSNGRRMRPWHIVLGVVGALAVGVALVTGIGRLAGYGRMADALGDGQYGWLASCAVGQLAVFTAYTGALRRAVAEGGGPLIPAGLAVRLVLAGFAATQIFAFGGAAGLALTWWAFRRAGMSSEGAAVRLVGLSTAVYFVFGLIGWSAALAALVLGAAPVGVTIPWVAGIPIVLAAATWFTEPRRVGRWTSPREGIVRRGLAIGISAAAWVRRALHTERPLFAWAALYWLADVFSLWGGLHAFGARPGLVALTVSYATGYLVSSLPIPLIATGGVDAATTFLLHAVGVPLDLALVGVVAHRVFAFWLPVIPGSLLAVTFSRLGRDLEDASEPSVTSSSS